MPLKHYNIPVFVPEEGCPHRCIFCNQHAITHTQSAPDPAEVPQIVKQWTARFGHPHRHVELAFFGGSFTGITPSRQEAFLKVAAELKSAGEIDAIRLSTRPDYVDEATLNRLVRFGVNTVELGVQSLDDGVLFASGRGHTAADTLRAVRLIQEHGLGLVLQMMTGLPSDTPETCLSTARGLVALAPDAVRIYPCLVMRDSPLAQLYRAGKYTPQTLDEAVELAARLLSLFLEAGIVVLRVGLHPDAASHVVAGPWHKAMSELVSTRFYRHRLHTLLQNRCGGEQIAIACAPGEVNHVAGYRASNRRWLETLFSMVSFTTLAHLKSPELHVDCS